MAAAKGIWRSIFYSVHRRLHPAARVVFAVPQRRGRRRPTPGSAQAASPSSSTEALGTNWAGLVLFISASAQVFCATSCMTSALPDAVRLQPGRGGPRVGALARALRAKRVPANGVMLIAVVAALRDRPGAHRGQHRHRGGTADLPVAFYAVTSIAVIGLYLSFAIPIWLRWRAGDSFVGGAWNNGEKYQWMNLDRGRRDRHRVRLPDAAVHPGGQPVQRRLRLEVRELRADRHARRAAPARPSGGASRRRTGSPGRSTRSTTAVVEAFDT